MQAAPSPQGRQVGIGYSLWHQNEKWQDVPAPHKPWGTPALGFYRSDDPSVLTRHASMLSASGVDFVVVDWSNDLGMDMRRTGEPGMRRFIETATIKMFDTWSGLAGAPRTVLMIGNPGDKDGLSNGKLSAKADEVHELFVADAAHAPRLQTYQGKPLLIVYVGTPTPWGHSLPPWRDNRFTVRFMTGFLTQQTTLLSEGGVSKYGYWSWEDRGEPTYSVFDGKPECMTVVAAWRGQGTRGRDGGRTYVSEWEHACKIGPRFVLAGTFNEWWKTEQISAEGSKDVETSQEHGSRYMDILREQAGLFKAGK
ncbi:MAG: hypothetical protein M3Y22_01420 [Pseudomonadota bacterium]|nr:hypothetical protein [Pseudomonadota bacterium]